MVWAMILPTFGVQAIPIEYIPDVYQPPVGMLCSQDIYLAAETPQATPLDSNPIRKKARRVLHGSNYEGSRGDFGGLWDFSIDFG